MHTHTIEVTEIPDDLFQRLGKRVQERGGDISSYIREVLEKELGAKAPVAGKTLDEIAAPLREDFKESGMTEEEFDALIEEVREEVWQEKHKEIGSR